MQQFNRNSVFAIANAKATEKDLGPASLKFTRKLLVVVGMATGAAGAFFTGTANAQESPVTTLGIGVAAAPRYEGSRNYQAVPLPILSASRGIFFVDGLEGGIAYNLSPNIRAGLVLAAQFGRDESDGDRLKGRATSRRQPLTELLLTGILVHLMRRPNICNPRIAATAARLRLRQSTS